MDIKQLRSFVAVANVLSFSRAALQLHLSQPALSTQIQALESHLGARLLERNRRTVRLTAAGESLLTDAEYLFQQIADIELRVARISSGEIGHLRIGFVASAMLELIPAFATAFRKQYPGVTLEIRNISTVQQVEALRAGVIDAGFVRMPLKEEGLSLDLVHREPFAIVVSKSHPLARQKNLSVKQLSDMPFITYGRRWAPAFFDHWTGICRDAGFSPTIVQETAEMETALMLVAAGMGVAILPEGITRRNRKIVAVTVLNREKIRSEIGIATAQNKQTPLLQQLIATAKKIGQP
jgi:LysR family transcriptional regulator, benzoate and cis,cis-muconate-responsive activator of ben and cat genes